MTIEASVYPHPEWTLEEWRDWCRDHADMHFGTVQIDHKVLLAIVAARDSALEQVEATRKAWDEERQRL